jgi:hypothetical protein
VGRKWESNCILNCMSIECFTFRVLVWMDSNVGVTPDCHLACCLVSVHSGIVMVFLCRWLVSKLSRSGIRTAACSCSVPSIRNTDVKMCYKTYSLNVELFRNVDTETVDTEVHTV